MKFQIRFLNSWSYLSKKRLRVVLGGKYHQEYLVNACVIFIMLSMIMILLSTGSVIKLLNLYLAFGLGQDVANFSAGKFQRVSFDFLSNWC